MPKRMIRKEPQKRAQIKELRVATKEGGAVKGGQEVPPSPYRPAKRLP